MQRGAYALLLGLLTLGGPLGRRASAQQATPTSPDTERAPEPVDPAAEADEPAPDDYQLPDDLDELDGGEEPGADDYQLPADLDDDYALPDDLDDDGGDSGESGDEWNFDEIPEGSGPPVLPLFGETTFSLTSSTTAQYRFDNFNSNQYDDDYFSFWEKLEFAMQGEHLRLGMRLDAFVPLGTSDCPEAAAASCFYEHDVRLERFSLHYERGDFTVEAVDSYAVLGRGIALSLRRVDLLGVDNTLRGGQVGYDEGRVFARLLGGSVNPQNLDPQTLRIIREPKDQLRRDLFSNPERRDFIMGGEAGYRLPGVSLGVHAVRTWFGEQEGSEGREVDIFGWRVDAPSLFDGKLSLYGEVNGLRRHSRPEFGEETVDTGRAIYAAAQITQGPMALLLEWKDYSNYRLAQTNGDPLASRVYSAAPTLERAQERPEALHNARGARLQMDYGFRPGPWSLSVNALVYGFAENIEVDPWDGILVTHGFAKVQRVPQAQERVGWSFAMEAGYRRETYIEDDPFFGDIVQNAEYATVFHGLIEGGVVLGQHSLEAALRHRDERHHEGLAYVEFVRGELSLTYSFRGRVRVSPVLSWNTQSVAAGSPRFYGGLEARVDFLQGSFLRVFGGQTPGGLLCSGGVCREVPPFQGITTELVLRL